MYPVAPASLILFVKRILISFLDVIGDFLFAQKLDSITEDTQSG
jgi:hypothetical protein